MAIKYTIYYSCTHISINALADSKVHYSMLKVRGEFNPAWLDALAKRRAIEELSRLEERTSPLK